MIRVLTKRTPRTSYIFEKVLPEFLGCAVDLVEDQEAFLTMDGARISYTEQPVDGTIHIQPAKLLFTSGTQVEEPNCRKIYNKVWLFPNEGEVGFDPFAAMFYLLARCEEYQPFEPDAHGRFSAAQSFAYRQGFWMSPVVDHWIQELQELLSTKYPNIQFNEPQFSLIPTVDIDNAYAYLGKGAFRNLGGLLRDLASFGFNRVGRRFKALFGGKDPYDTYDTFLPLIKDLQPCFFIPIGDRAPLDKNLPHTSTRYQELIKRLGAVGEVGLHPSYNSNQDPSILKEEKVRLEKILGRSVTSSRQHYLKVSLPETYERLESVGITDDYSMGYADGVGFRAGTSRSFFFYNLRDERSTMLRVHPFAYMDGTLNEYQKMTQEEAKSTVSVLKKEVCAVRGRFIFIWHNDTLNNLDHWAGWQSVFHHTLEED